MADSDSDDEFEFGTTVVDAGATSLKVNVLGQSFTLSQQLEPKDLAPLFSDEWTGSQVWSCSVVLSTFIGQSVEKGEIVLKDKNVVELGAGCGLCGIYAHYLGGKIIATDQKPMVPLIRRNAEANSITKNFEVRELVWGDHEAVKALPRSSIVLISDCINPIYGEGSYEALAKTILWIGERTDDKKEFAVFLAYEHRDGGGKASQMLLQTFFNFLKPKMSVKLALREEDIDIYLIKLQ